MFNNKLFEGKVIYKKIEYNEKIECFYENNYLMGFCDNIRRVVI